MNILFKSSLLMGSLVTIFVSNESIAEEPKKTSNSQEKTLKEKKYAQKPTHLEFNRPV